MSKTTALFPVVVSLVIIVTLAPPGRASVQPPVDASDSACPPLPGPIGVVVDVSSVAELLDAVEGVCRL